MLGSQCCCVKCPKCREDGTGGEGSGGSGTGGSGTGGTEGTTPPDGDLPDTVTVTLNDYKGEESPPDSGCYPCDCHAGERTVVLRRDDNNKCRFFHNMCIGEAGPPLITLVFESKCGSGADADVEAPVGVPARDSGPITEVTMRSHGEGYACAGRKEPSATHAVNAEGCVVPVSVTWAERENECGFPYWTVTNVTLEGAAGEGCCFTDGGRLQIFADMPGTTEQCAEIDVTPGTAEPSLYAYTGGNGHFSLTLAPNGETPETWRVDTVTVDDGGEGWTDGQGFDSFGMNQCSVMLSPAHATIHTRHERPSNCEASVFSSSGGYYSLLRGIFSSSPIAGPGGRSVWQVESVEVLESGSSYSVGDTVYLGPFNPPPDDLTVVADMSAEVSAVNEDGGITEVNVLDGGKYFHDSGVAVSVEVNDGGRYVSNRVISRITLVSGGRMYEEDDTLPPIATAVTVRIDQIFPSAGEGAVLVPVIGLDPDDPATFGTIVSVTVEDGGDGYLKQSTLTRKPISVEFLGLHEYAVVTVDRETQCSYSMTATEYVTCPEFSFEAENNYQTATAHVTPGGEYDPSYFIPEDLCCGACCDTSTHNLEYPTPEKPGDCDGTSKVWVDPVDPYCPCGTPDNSSMIRYTDYKHAINVNAGVDDATLMQPPGKDIFDCNGINTNCPDPPDPELVPQPTCCGESVSGFLYSAWFNFDLDEQPCHLAPRAKIFAGATMDDTGSVGGVDFTPHECQFSTLDEDHVVIPEIEQGDGRFRLKVPYTVNNGIPCGPYGIHDCYILYYFERGDGCGESSG